MRHYVLEWRAALDLAVQPSLILAGGGQPVVRTASQSETG